MANITNHGGNANQTIMKYYFAPVGVAVIKKPESKQVLVRMWRKGNPRTTVGGNVK